MLFTATRLPGWEQKLIAYLGEPGRDVFDWGTNDCALFGCGGVLAMTGEHPAPEFVGAYDSRQGAAEALRRLGAGTLEATFDAHFERKKPSFAQRGDLVFCQGAVGICVGNAALFLQQEAEGFVRLPRPAFAIAWKV